jgi:hypothetical protein
MEELSSSTVKTTRDTKGISPDSFSTPSPIIDIKLIPKDGIALSVTGTLKPFYLRINKEFIIGRKPEDPSENFLDLSKLDGFNMGISRRHVMIRRAEAGYEVIDLSSTNGTWMNDERLIPEKPYPLKSGARLRIGRLNLLLVYRAAVETLKDEQA